MSEIPGTQQTPSPYFEPEQCCPEAIQNIINSQIDILDQYWPALFLENNTEAVHECRKALRRSTTALTFFNIISTSSTSSDLIEAISSTLKPFGKLRDIQILIENLALLSQSELVQENENWEKQLADLFKTLQKEEKRLNKNLLENIQPKKYPAEVKALGKLEKHLDYGSEIKKETQLDNMENIISFQIENCVNFSSVQNLTDKPKKLHKLRLAFKHLRYTLHFFEYYLEENSQTLLQITNNIQDDLGLYNDAVVGEKLLQAFGKSSEITDLLNNELESQRTKNLNNFKTNWSSFLERVSC